MENGCALGLESAGAHSFLFYGVTSITSTVSIAS